MIRSPRSKPAENTIDKYFSKKSDAKDDPPKKEAKEPIAIISLDSDAFACKESESVSADDEKADPVPAEVPKTAATAASTAATLPPFHPETFNPLTDASWNTGESVPYAHLARTFSLLEKMKARLKMIDLLTDLFRSVIVRTPADLLACFYLCSNRIASAFEGIELGIGESLLMRAIAEATGRTVAAVQTDLHQRGDLGDVAQESRLTQRTIGTPAPLSAAEVYASLRDIATIKGNASMQVKVDKVKKLLTRCREHEARYLIRTLQGNIRIGVLLRTLLVALARAFVLNPPEEKGSLEPANFSAKRNSLRSSPRGKNAASKQVVDLDNDADEEEASDAKALEEIIKGDNVLAKLRAAAAIVTKCAGEMPHYNLLIENLLRDGVWTLTNSCHFTVGVPASPMLAAPSHSFAEVGSRFGAQPLTCEFKYDGERAQIHCIAPENIRIFSRNCEEHTPKYPDVTQMLSSVVESGVISYVLDTEVCAWDRTIQTLLPFDKLATRPRRDAQINDIKVQVCVFAFDLLYLNGKALVDTPLSERRRLLHTMFHESAGAFHFVRHLDVGASDVQAITDFLKLAVANRCEGLMAKRLDSLYLPSKRSLHWLKLKKDYLDSSGDTIDAVVVGAYHGRGQRTGKYGSFLLAVYDESSGDLQTISNCMSGFTDQFLEEAHSKLSSSVINTPHMGLLYGEAPDVWVTPSLVWEIAFADLSLSPTHKAAVGLVHEARGISMRFPRFKRARDDKATTAQQVADMFEQQSRFK